MQHLDKFNIIDFDTPIQSYKAIRQTEYIRKIAKSHRMIFPVSFYEYENFIRSLINKEELVKAFCTPDKNAVNTIFDYYEKTFLNLVRQTCNILLLKISECETENKDILLATEDPVSWFIDKNAPIPFDSKEKYIRQHAINKFLITTAFQEACALLFHNLFDHEAMLLPVYKENIIKKYHNSQDFHKTHAIQSLKEEEIKHTLNLLSESITI